MERQALLRQKALIESLLIANLKEVEYIKTFKEPDWVILDTYYIAGRALAAEHMEIINQLQWR